MAGITSGNTPVPKHTTRQVQCNKPLSHNFILFVVCFQKPGGFEEKFSQFARRRTRNSSGAVRNSAKRPTVFEDTSAVTLTRTASCNSTLEIISRNLGLPIQLDLPVAAGQTPPPSCDSDKVPVLGIGPEPTDSLCQENSLGISEEENAIKDAPAPVPLPSILKVQ